jgi:hypothetical protein
MKGLRESIELIAITLAVFVLLGIGAWLSPTYSQQKTYAEWFVFAGALLFVASLVIVVAAVGFRTFALYLTVLCGMALAAFGIEGLLWVVGLTYTVWGFVFSLQLLLAHHHVPSAIHWFRTYYTVTTFQAEFRLFYPMHWLMYALLERIPRLLERETSAPFDPRAIATELIAILPE